MKFVAVIISLAGLAVAATEIAPGIVTAKQDGQKVTIDSVEALRILQTPCFPLPMLPPLTATAVPTVAIVMTACLM
ncbi:hypothetical protein N7523_007815 [Penicillium sp. IBT 18751x]|nr:hypothetical protein N7523_007815 [Penicillium sp. IBT 18751x]